MHTEDRKNKSLHFDTVAAMLAAQNVRDGEVAFTKRYSTSHTVGDGSGGAYVYHSTGRSGITANGGFFHNGAGADDYWELKDQTVANVMQFGAVGDGTTDDAAAVQAAIDSGADVHVPKGEYDVSSGLTANASCIIRGDGVLLHAEDAHMLTVTQTLPANTSCTITTADATTASSPPKLTQVTASSHGLEVGDVVKLTANKAYTYSAQAWVGEMARVSRVIDANTFLLDHFLIDISPGDTGIVYTKLAKHPVDINIRTRATGAQVGTTTFNVVRVITAVDPQISVHSIGRSYNTLIEASNCWQGRLKAIATDVDNSELVAGRIAYGVVVGGGSRYTDVQVQCDGARHGVTSLNYTRSTYDAAIIAQHGRSAHVNVHDSFAAATVAAGFDTHEQAYGWSFVNCQVVGVVPKGGSDTQLVAYQDRGEQTRFVNCLAKDCRTGFLLNSGTINHGSGSNVVELVSPRIENASYTAISLGTSTYKSQRLVVTSPVAVGANGAFIFNGTDGNIQINGGDVACTILLSIYGDGTATVNGTTVHGLTNALGLIRSNSGAWNITSDQMVVTGDTRAVFQAISTGTLSAEFSNYQLSGATITQGVIGTDATSIAGVSLALHLINKDTVAEMRALTGVPDGTRVDTARYSTSHTVGDGSGGEYVYHATGRSGITADGGFFHNGAGADDYWELKDQTVANVMQFGAREGTNSYSAIQAALESGAEKVVFPTGTWTTNTQLEITTNLEIVGEGRSVLQAGASMTYVLTNNAAGPDYPNQFLTIRKLRVDGNSLATTGVYLTKIAAGLVEQVFVENCTGDGFVANECQGGTFLEVSGENNGGAGIVSRDCNASKWISCKGRYNDGDGIVIAKRQAAYSAGQTWIAPLSEANASGTVGVHVKCESPYTPVAVTVDAGTDVFTAAGFANNQTVRFKTDGTLPAGLSGSVYYWVVNASGSTFQVSATMGGAAVNVTDTGTGTHTVERTPPQATAAVVIHGGWIEHGIGPAMVIDGMNVVMNGARLSGSDNGVSGGHYVVEFRNTQLTVKDPGFLGTGNTFTYSGGTSDYAYPVAKSGGWFTYTTTWSSTVFLGKFWDGGGSIRN